MSEDQDDKNGIVDYSLDKDAFDRNIKIASISSFASICVIGFVFYKTIDKIVNAKIIDSWTRSIRSIKTALREFTETELDLTDEQMLKYIKNLHLTALKESDTFEAISLYEEIMKYNIKARLEDNEPLLWIDILSSNSALFLFEEKHLNIKEARKMAER
jgi:site-specific recombinase XerD